MYPAGTGGHYQRSPDAPAYRASSGESFTGGAPFHEGQPSEQIARPGVDVSRAGAYPSQEPAPTNKMAQKAAVAGATVKETGAGVVSKSKEYGQRMTDKAREYDKSGRAEESANRAGESIGRAIRKAMVLGKEMSSGIRKGLGRESESRGKERPRDEEPRYREEAPREAVEQESYAREEMPRTEKVSREVRREEP
jgi:hypothetical protein